MTARAIFQHYDADGNGYLEYGEVLKFFKDISLREKQEGLQETATEEDYVDKILKIADENGDNKLSEQELVELVQRIFAYNGLK